MKNIPLIILLIVLLFIPLSLLTSWVSFVAINQLFGTSLVLTLHNWLAWVWLTMIGGGAAQVISSRK